MNGLMMQQPLLISTLLTHAERHHGTQQVVSRRVEGDVHRYTYRELGARARSMANALSAQGIRFGDRVATLAWNGYRHMELYYAVSGSGAVALLHIRHHRKPEGSTLQPSLNTVTYICGSASRRLQLLGTRLHPPSRADVPRERVGPPLRGLYGGRQTGIPWSVAGRQVTA